MSKTILITGGTGFLGSHLIRSLINNHYQVIALKRSFSNTEKIEDLVDKISCYDLDKCNLEKPFQDFTKIDTVIHLATAYGRQNEAPSSICEANLIFPLKLLEMAIAYGTPLFINTGTYFNKESIPYQGLVNYSLSKYQFHQWGKQLALSNKIRFINAQLEHIFGSRDDQSKFITFVINSCLNNVEELELTAGEQKRDFVHVDNVVSAYLLLLEKASSKSEMYQNYEIGTGESISLREFVELVHKLTKSKTLLKFGARPYRDNEIMYSQANIQSLVELGWQPDTNLEGSLLKVIKDEQKPE